MRGGAVMILSESQVRRSDRVVCKDVANLERMYAMPRCERKTPTKRSSSGAVKGGRGEETLAQWLTVSHGLTAGRLLASKPVGQPDDISPTVRACAHAHSTGAAAPGGGRPSGMRGLAEISRRVIT